MPRRVLILACSALVAACAGCSDVGTGVVLPTATDIETSEDGEGDTDRVPDIAVDTATDTDVNVVSDADSETDPGSDVLDMDRGAEDALDGDEDTDGSGIFDPDTEADDGTTEPDDSHIFDIDTGPEFRCTIFVSTMGDDAHGGYTWGTAKATVQAGIDTAADAGLARCEVWIAAGTYFPTVEVLGTGDRYRSITLVSGVHVFGGFAGTETIRSERDIEANPAILSGDIDRDDVLDDDNVYHVVYSLARATIDGVTITMGNADDPEASQFNGGGILAPFGELELANCAFTNNFTVGMGAAVSISDGTLKVTNCTFEHNRVGHTGSGGGGAIFGMNSEIEVMESTFVDNHAWAGGALSSSGGRMTVDSCRFTGNRTRHSGGAIDANGSTIVVSNSSFTENFGPFGGAVYAGNESDVAFADCRFSDNAGPISGGALHLSGSTPHITGCLFLGNVTDYRGGALAVADASDPEIVNCAFVANGSGASGGAIHVAEACHLSVVNSLFWANTTRLPGYGPNIYHEPGDEPGTTELSYSLLGEPCAAVTGAICGDGVLEGDPMVGPVPVLARLVSGESGTEDTVEVGEYDSNTFFVGDRIEIGNDDTFRTVSDVHGTSDGSNKMIVTFSPALHEPAIIGTRIYKWPSDATSAVVDPHPQPGSACIDAGDDRSAPDHDLDGNPRVDDLATDNCPVPDLPDCDWFSDIGVFEYEGS